MKKWLITLAILDILIIIANTTLIIEINNIIK